MKLFQRIFVVLLGLSAWISAPAQMYRHTVPSLLALQSGVTLPANLPTTIAVTPHGATVIVGTSITATVGCTYASHAADDCTYAGGAVWSSPTAALQPVNGGTFAGGNITWSSTYDPNNTTLFPAGSFSAIGIIRACVLTLCDTGQMVAQPVGTQFVVFTTPDGGIYGDIQTGAYPLPTVAVGATVTIGAGFTGPGGSSANPFQMACNWTSSDTTVATIDRYGLATAVAPGSVTMTCGAAGNGQYTTMPYSGITFPFNVVAPTPTLQTRYVRPKGGTPFVNSTQTPNGQCDGLHDTDYPGTGVDQPCAVSNLRDLWADRVSPNHDTWMIGPGDKVIVRQNPAGYNLGLDALAGNYGGTYPNSPINCGNPDCFMPSIPSGTAAHHTQILGENYGSCHDDSAKTKLLVTWASKVGLNVRDSQYVDVACLEVTQVTPCAYSGAFTNHCPGSSNYGLGGITQSAFTSFVTFTDLFLHGLAAEAINGATGKGVVYDHLHIRGVPFAGFDMDDGPHNYSNISVAGGLTLTNSLTEFVGCIEENPVVHNYPYIECRDQQLGGYGDGFGTGSMTGNWYFDHDIWRYNYQDGLDLLHAGAQSIVVTNSQSYGNDGNPFKLGSSQNVVFQNNIAVSNCYRLLDLFGDEPASVLTAGTPLLCRANGNVPVELYSFGSTVVQDNTFIGYADVLLSSGCDSGSDNCSTNASVLQNNLFFGYGDTHNSDSKAPAPLCDAWANDCDGNLAIYPANQGWATRSNNLFTGLRKCPVGLVAGETCNTLQPFLVSTPMGPAGTIISDETVFDAFDANIPVNASPGSGSPLLGAGIDIVGLTQDLSGVANPEPPNIGAFNVVTGSTVTQPPPPVVVPVAPTITWNNPVSVVYGTALSATQLNAAANTPGTFVYSPALGTTPSVGTNTLSVTFTPTDTVHYTTATAFVTLTVVKAQPVITWANAAPIM